VRLKFLSLLSLNLLPPLVQVRLGLHTGMAVIGEMGSGEPFLPQEARP
jgi:class 3 adenylate cyclase